MLGPDSPKSYLDWLWMTGFRILKRIEIATIKDEDKNLKYFAEA